MGKKTKVAACLVGLVAVVGGGGAVAASQVLAPGTTLAGESVAWQPPQRAWSEAEAALEAHRVVVEGVPFTLQELALEAQQDEHSYEQWTALRGKFNQALPLSVEAEHSEDRVRLLQERLPQLSPPQDAAVTLEEGEWRVTPAPEAKTLNLPAVVEAVNRDLQAGEATTEVSLEAVEAEVTTQEAEAVAASLNERAATATYGSEEVGDHSVPQGVAAGFFTVASEGGELRVGANRGAVEAFVATLPEALNSASSPGRTVVDEEGRVLATLVRGTPSVVVDEAKTTESLLASVEAGGPVRGVVAAAFEAAPVEALFRKALVNLTTHRVTLLENGAVVADFPVAVGALTPERRSDVGSFHVHTQYEAQNMGCTPDYDYCLKGVPWISYYNGGEGLHGAPWQTSFGTPTSNSSHGCINLRVPDAEVTYRFLEVGSPVEVVE